MAEIKNKQTKNDTNLNLKHWTSPMYIHVFSNKFITNK